MNEFLSENLTSIVGAAVLLVLAWVAWSILKPKRKVIGEDMKLNVRCRGCGWQGVVTKYNQQCRRCGKDDLQQLGRPS